MKLDEFFTVYRASKRDVKITKKVYGDVEKTKAEWIAELSGKIAITIITAQTQEKRDAIAEIMAQSKQRKAERIAENKIKHPPNPPKNPTNGNSGKNPKRGKNKNK